MPPENLKEALRGSGSFVPRKTGLDPSKLHIHGIGVGAMKSDIYFKYKDCGEADGWALFGETRVDPDTGIRRPFLAALFDEQDRVVVLRGSSIGYNGMNGLSGWERIEASGLLPPRSASLASHTNPHDLIPYDDIGLMVSYLDGPVEFFIGEPAVLRRIRLDNLNLLLDNYVPCLNYDSDLQG